MCLVVQTETILGLANLEAIANVEGVDAAFIWLSDHAASPGRRGKVSHPAVQAAVLLCCRDSGVREPAASRSVRLQSIRV